MDQVELDLLWVKRLEQWLRLGRQFALGLGGLFTLGALIVVGNTVRLSIENRRDEILVTQLVGGTRAISAGPFSTPAPGTVYWAGYWPASPSP